MKPFSLNPKNYIFSQFLSFFIKNQFRISSFRTVRGNHDKIHICKNSKTSLSTKFRLQLISQIGCLIIQELYFSAVWKPIFQIHIVTITFSANSSWDKPLLVRSSKITFFVSIPSASSVIVTNIITEKQSAQKQLAVS